LSYPCSSSSRWDISPGATIIPLTVVLREIHRQQTSGDAGQALRSMITQSLADTFKKPMVWAPLLGVGLVLVGMDVPQLLDNMLMLIGSTISGASIFLAGLIIAAYEIRLSAEITVQLFS
jgi:malonate transporter and related proteins